MVNREVPLQKIRLIRKFALYCTPTFGAKLKLHRKGYAKKWVKREIYPLFDFGFRDQIKVT